MILCEECEYGIIRVIRSDEDLTLFNIVCGLDGFAFEEPPIECNRFKTENKTTKGFFNWDYQHK